MRPIPAHPSVSPSPPYVADGAHEQWQHDVEEATNTWDALSIASLIGLLASGLARQAQFCTTCGKPKEGRDG